MLDVSVRGRLPAVVATSAIVVLLCAAGAAVASAAAPVHNPRGKLLGVVTRSETPAQRSQQRAALRATATAGLRYHGGPVMRTNRVYSIFWQGSSSFTDSYKGLIDRYLRDVAADSGKRTNVYSSDTQYFDTTGHIAYSTTYGGKLGDAQTFPGSGCVDPARPTAPCLTDTQVQAELRRFLDANPSLPRGSQTVYVIVLPPQVGVCFDGAFGAPCSFSTGGFCAYHSASGAANALYTVQPYPDTGGCDVGQHPNGDVAADNTVSLVSHEHNETITDPYGTGWFDDTNGLENGDICQFDFGAPLGGTASGAFNQVINGNPYWTQEEWSDIDGGCVQRSAARPPSPSFFLSPNPATAGRAVSFNATQSTDVDGNITGFSWTFGDGTTGSGATPAHVYAKAGAYTASLTVADDGGASATTSTVVTVSGGTTISSLSHGTITVGRNGRFKYSLKGTPARSSGRISFATKNAIAAVRRRKLSFGSVAFTLSGSGKATVTVKLSRANFAILKRKRTLKMRGTARIGAVSKSAIFTLKAPRR